MLNGSALVLDVPHGSEPPSSHAGAETQTLVVLRLFKPEQSLS